MLTAKIYFFLLISCLLFHFPLMGQIDSINKNSHRNILLKSIVPLSLMASGITISDSRLEKSINTEIRGWTGDNFNSSIDDYTRYIPVAQLYVADIAGVRSKNHWFDQTKNLVISMLLTDMTTKLLKRKIYKVRPNGFNAKSFPSGHTSVAFSSAAVLYEEFKSSSPILAYSGFGFATTTGAFRLLNNKHWSSDVLMGAGLGIFITKLVYHFDHLFAWNPFVDSKELVLIPRIYRGAIGFHFSKKF